MRSELLGRLVAGVEGSVIMTFAFAFPVLLGATALAVDSAGFYDQQSRMQAVADAAALATAKELHVYRKQLDELSEVGKVKVETMLGEAGIAEQPHTTDVGIDPDLNLITVSISMVGETLLPVDVWGTNPIVVESQAHAYGQERLCILALDGNRSDTLKAEKDSTLNAPECAVQSNSVSSTGLNVESGSRMVSTVICSAGGTAGGSGSYEPRPETDCPKLDDPLAERAPPSFSGCTYNDLVISRSEEIGGGSTPTVFCGGLKVERSAVLSLLPGIYVIAGGKLEITDQAQLIGENVSFYFDDDAATLAFNPDTTIDLSAPKEGPMAGILFYENRTAAVGRKFSIKSRFARRMLGTIYLPKGLLEIDAKADVADQSAYTVLVIRRLHVKSANLVVNSDYGGTDVPVPDGVGPYSKMVAIAR